MKNSSKRRPKITNVSQTLYDRPVLVIDPGKHTAIIRSADSDAEGLWVVTGSDDKTVRIWSLSDGSLFRTIRLPAGSGHIGKVYTVAISPDGGVIAAGGWTRYSASDPQENIYLYDRESGKLLRCIQGLPMQVCHLVFSLDGNFLAATLGDSGLRIYGGDQGWEEIARDEKYGGESHGADFALDGRLATTSFDGLIRIYSNKLEGALQPSATIKCRKGLPHGVAFSTNDDGARLAVGFHNKTKVEIRDGYNLSLLKTHMIYVGYDDITSMKDLDIEQDRMSSYGGLQTVAWSVAGDIVFAAGDYKEEEDSAALFGWDNMDEEPKYSVLNVPCPLLTKIIMLPIGDLLVAGDNGVLASAKTSDSHLFWHWQDLSWNPLISLNRDSCQRINISREGIVTDNMLSASSDGTLIDFRYSEDGLARFDFNLRQISIGPPSDGKVVVTHLGRTDDDSISQLKIGNMFVSGWDQVSIPPFALFGDVVDVHDLVPLSVNDHPIKFDSNERTVCLAAHPDGESFVVGCEFSLRNYNAKGELLWKFDSPATLGLNITSDGRLVVAAYADSTIRWHRMKDGVQLLAFTMLSNETDWVAWTPEGFYGASAPAYGILRWHINQGWDALVDDVPIHEIPGSFRPAMLPLVLQELEIPRALGLAVLAEHNRQITIRTPSKLPPGVQLHLLAIGISTYKKDCAKNMHLKYAHLDARDLANTILNTQAGSLYSKVSPQVLTNRDATLKYIMLALDKMNTTISGVNDLAVVFFSGHGSLIGNELYLLPYDIDTSSDRDVKLGGLSIKDFRKELEQLAGKCHVLILLDACYSGAITMDLTPLDMDSKKLSLMLAAANVTVLASSSGNEVSRENSEWEHGAFTKVLLDAFNADHGADSDHNGLISITELANFAGRNISSLTAGKQTLGMEIHHDITVFASSI